MGVVYIICDFPKAMVLLVIYGINTHKNRGQKNKRWGVTNDLKISTQQRGGLEAIRMIPVLNSVVLSFKNIYSVLKLGS